MSREGYNWSGIMFCHQTAGLISRRAYNRDFTVACFKLSESENE